MKNKKTHALLSFLLMCITISASYGQEIQPGARYTGNYTKSQQIKYVRKNNIVIEGLEISSSNDNCITLYDCENVTIRNCKLGPSLINVAIMVDNCKNITITDCTFENIQSGVVAHKSQGIKVEFNDFTNVIGRSRGATRVGVMAQFDKVSGVANSISYNVCENIPDQSSTEDIINLYSSHGTSASPIVVKGNWIRGGGPSTSGGGIILGDMGGSYQIAENNILVNPGQYGVSIAGGNDMTLRGNKVYASRKPFNNVGVYACNFYSSISKSYNITVERNEINYTNKLGNINNTWFANNVGIIKNVNTNIYKRDLNESVLPVKIIGRARNNDTDSQAPPVTEPTGDTFALPKIYVDKFNRICVNYSGETFYLTSITISQDGKIIANQITDSYHTVINNRFASGEYDVLVDYGGKLEVKKVVIK